MDWKTEYQKVIDNPPEAGTILTPLSGKAKLHIDLIVGVAPFMYGLVYTPCIVGEPVGWFARSIDDASTFGWKLILLPKARDRVIREFGIAKTVVPVDGFKIIRQSRQGKSWLVELWDRKV